MIVTWTVQGVNWSQDIKSSIDSNPSEVATRGVETLWKNLQDHEELEFGALIRISHDRMQSENEHWFVFTPDILANAGMYDDADKLKNPALRELLS